MSLANHDQIFAITITHYNHDHTYPSSLANLIQISNVFQIIYFVLLNSKTSWNFNYSFRLSKAGSEKSTERLNSALQIWYPLVKLAPKSIVQVISTLFKLQDYILGGRLRNLIKVFINNHL